MDLWILVLPLRLILRIPRPSREKLALFIIFGLGIISTIASIIRLQSLRIFTLSEDPFYDSLPINTWSMVEVNIGLLCASIPTLKPLVSKAHKSQSRYALYKSDDKRIDVVDVEWVGDSKVPILKTGKDLMISLHPSTLKGNLRTLDEECEMDEIPPRPPPKDARSGATQRAREYQQVIRHPDLAFQRI
jgi:hypothetical protein